MHIQITILDGHTGINLGVWYPWVAAHVFNGVNLQKIYNRSHKMSFIHVQLLSKIFIDSDFCHNYLHTLYVFACLL